MSSASGVFVKDKEFGWLPASILSTTDATAQVSVKIPKHEDDGTGESFTKEDRSIKLKDYEDATLPLQNIDEGGNAIVAPDMCDLHSLHEAAILYNLKERHASQHPYTRVGDIVIAMNPFQWIQSLYSESKRQLYSSQLIYNTNTSGDSKACLDPHVYEVSSLAYRGLALNGRHQSILVSGESGAGKTETVKIIMSHLASIHRLEVGEYDGEKKEDSICRGGGDEIVKRVLDSNPLLEAFGNAKTVRNDNSSRFGKYIQLQFDVEDATTAAISGKTIPSCLLAGSVCETYLLEKSRVVRHEASERTFHIFYQLLAAPEDQKAEIWDGLQGKGNDSFAFVGETDTKVIEHRTDGENWQRTVDALSLIGITGDVFRDLMRAICTVMQLGNLIFGIDPNNEDGSIVTNVEELKKLSSLMGVEETSIQKALTYRTIYAAKESYSVPLRVSGAKDCCDAFAKAIYQHAFDRLVRGINTATCAEENYPDSSAVNQWGFIGLLDIFGFESFEVNRFEQFSINYANEKLQQKYNLDVFSSVQDEYEYEGITMPSVQFEDNSEVLNLVEGRMGMINMLNDECLRPHGNDASFVSKVKTVNKDVESLDKNPLHKPTEFGISHYAGPVVYDATYFVQKNNDRLAKDLVDCAKLSSSELIKSEVGSIYDQAPTSSSTPGRVGRSKQTSQSVSSKFRSQLSTLMVNIDKTASRYVRCIKPNPQKIPKKTDLISTVQQLRCAGVVAAVTISRVSYPNRLTHESAIERFASLVSTNDQPAGSSEESGKVVKCLMDSVLAGFDDNCDSLTPSCYELGKSRVYFKAGALEFLEAKRMKKLSELAVKIQTITRKYLAQSYYLSMKEKSTYIQSLARRNKARSDLFRARAAITTLSCWIRCINARTELNTLRRNKCSTLIQTRFRIMSARMFLSKNISSAVVIQRIWRGALQRPLYRQMIVDAKEEARVNSKIAALQKRLAEAEMKLIRADRERSQGQKAPTENSSTTEEKKDEEDEKNKSLIDESTEMIEFLRKENFQLKSKTYLLKTDLNQLKATHLNLSEQYASLHDSFKAMRKHSSSLSKTAMKSNVQSLLHKKDISIAKKEIKSLKLAHKMEISKLKGLMKAKDLDNAEEIARMQAEIEFLRERERHSNGPNVAVATTRNARRGDSKKNRVSRRRRPSQNLQIETKIQGGKSSRTSPRDDPPSQVTPGSATSMSEDRWGHSGFFELNGMDEPSPPTINNSGTSSLNSSMHSTSSRNRGNRKPMRPPMSQTRSFTTAQQGQVVISPEQSSSKTSRVQSTTSLREALKKRNIPGSKTELNNRPNSKPSSRFNSTNSLSSLASAAAKKNDIN